MRRAIGAALLLALAPIGASSHSRAEGSATSAIDVGFAAVSRGGATIGICRGIATGDWIILNWHCLADLRKALTDGKTLIATLGGAHADLPREALEHRAPAALKVAESAGLDFTLLRSPFAPAPDLVVAQPEITPGASVSVRHDDKVVATCSVTRVCGSRIFYNACSATPKKGWSGSSVWLTREAPQLIAIHKDGPEFGREGSARLLSAVLGRSSTLAPSASAFSASFARNRQTRFRRDMGCPVANAQLQVRPFITVGNRTVVGMVRTDDRTILTTDINTGQVCKYLWPSPTAARCWANPDPFNHRVNAIHPMDDGLFALGKSNNGEAQDDGALRLFRFGEADTLALEPDDIAAPIGAVFGMNRVGETLVAVGARGLCTLAQKDTPRRCVRPPDPDGAWRVNGVLPLGSDHFVAVGSDQDDTGLTFPQCKWFVRHADEWKIVGRCARGRSLMEVARALHANGRGLQFKAPVLLDGQIVVFGSDGGAYQIKPNHHPRYLPIRGVFQSEGRLEDAVRDAKALGDQHAALAASDGTLRIVKLIHQGPEFALRAYDVGAPNYTAFDLAIWTTQIVAGDGWLLVRGQDGGVHGASWSRLP